MDIIKGFETAEEYGTKDVQVELLDLLKKFHNFCENHEIKYSINSGTALGAVRHKGFIPWDDDADIMMDRENFQKLLRLYQSYQTEYHLSRILWIYRLQPYGSEREGGSTIIDIFVVDNVPDIIFLRKLKLLLIRFLQGSMKPAVDYSKYPPVYRVFAIVTHKVGKLLKDERKYALYQKVSQIGNKSKTKYVGIYNNIYKALPRLYPSEMMSELELIDFEDTKLYITSGWDRYLSSVYGDYMTPPNPEDRKSGTFQINLNGTDMKLENMKHID